MENNISPAPNNATPAEPVKPNPALPQDPAETVILPVDPDYQRYLEETKDLPTAYKRYTDSSKEAVRQKEEREEIEQQKKQYEDYVNNLAQEVQIIQQNNPELLKQWQEAVTRGVTTPNQPQATQINPEQIEARAMRAAEFKVDLNKFWDDYGNVVKDEAEKVSIMKTAKNFEADGIFDPLTKKPYTLRGALLAATKLHHPELMKTDTTSFERRDSAAEAGNLPLSSRNSSSDEVDLTQEQVEVARKMGITPEAYAKRL